MKKQAYCLIDQAKGLREQGNISQAGQVYRAAAHEYAGEVTEYNFPSSDMTASALRSLLWATTCYRIAGKEPKVQNSCDLGTLLAVDYMEFIEQHDIKPGSFNDVRRGGWPEFIGDLRTIAKRTDANEAYDEALEIYNRCDEWEFVMGEGEHMRLASYFRSVKRGLGINIPRDAPEQMPLTGITFADWLEYKRERLPDLLDQLEDQGEWPTSSTD